MTNNLKLIRLVSLVTLSLTVATTSPITMAQDNTQAQVSANVIKANGVETVEFDTLTGTVEVNLPDDLSDTDIISGTVVVEPKGETKEEIAHNEAELTGYVVQIEKTQAVLEPPQTKKPGAQKPALSIPVIENHPPYINFTNKKKPSFTCKIPPKTGTVIVKVCTASGKTICQQPVKCNPVPPAAPTTCQIPATGTCGTPLRIPAKCDGRMATSKITIKGEECPLIAESPRQQICVPPLNVSGPCPIVVTECGLSTKAYINMLPAPTSSQPVAKTQSGKVVFWRTGPFITTHAIHSTNTEGPIQATANKVTVNYPDYSNGHLQMLQSTITVAIPPERITVGDKFSLPLSMSGNERAMMYGGWLTDLTWIGNDKVVQGKSPDYLSPYSQSLRTQTAETFTVLDYDARIQEYLKTNPSKTLPAGNSEQQPYLEFKGTVGPDGAASIKWIYVRKRPQIE